MAYIIERCKQVKTERKRTRTKLSQLWILIRKNLLIQRRHPWQTLLQFIVPALLGSLLQIGRSQAQL